MKRNKVNIDVDVLKKLIDDKYNGQIIKMERELDLGQTLKNALADGVMCKAYARLIMLETGVDIVKRVSLVEDMNTDEKIKFLTDMVESLYEKVNKLEDRFENETETQLSI